MSALALLAEPDLDWLTEAVDIVEQSVNRPWRDALERLDDLQRAAQPTAPRRFSAVVGALQRVAGGRAVHARAAREARELVLGHPVFSAIERQSRLTAAAEQLGTTATALETLLWADVPRERPVELPRGRPNELEVAAFANVALIQRAVRRARTVTIRTTDDAGPLLRTCARFGLLATATVTNLAARGDDARRGDDATRGDDARRGDDATRGDDAARGDGAARGDDAARGDVAWGEGSVVAIEIVGPLALFHRTGVYGKALADLVPLLGELRQFSLELEVETKSALYTTHVTAPVLLPSPPARLAAPSRVLTRLARAVERMAPELVVTPAPPPLVCAPPAGVVLCPDLMIERGTRRVYVEIIGFWTTEFVERRLASYRIAGVDALVCLDDDGGCDECDAPSGGLVFRKRITAAQIVEGLVEKWGSLCW